VKTSSTVVGIQYLRGLAALLVVADHASSMMSISEYFGRSPAGFLVYGAVGVPIFFVISGFIIAVVSLDRSLNGRLTIGEFYRRRFARIVPFMWVCVIGYNLLRLAGIGAFDWPPFLRAMFLWPIGDVRPNVIWTLRHESAFYFLFGLTMLGSVRRPFLLITWFVSPVLLWIIEWAMPGSLSLLPMAIQDLAGFFGNAVNLAFGAGFALGVMYVSGGRPLRPRFSGGFLLATVFCLMEFALLAIIQPPWDNLWSSFAITAISATLVWFGICLHPGVGAISRFGQFLGDASYSIYLVHDPILLIFLSAAAKLHLGGNIWANWGIMVILAVAGGSAVHVVIERPVIRIATQIVRPRDKIQQSAAPG
jgi:exopolysaccharide production protein ExoZ